MKVDQCVCMYCIMHAKKVTVDNENILILKENSKWNMKLLLYMKIFLAFTILFIVTNSIKVYWL